MICPDCNVGLKSSATSCPCGWKSPTAPTSTAGTGYGARNNGVDPDWWRCADVMFGNRCAKPGGMSHGTHGGGPWYCRDHFLGNSDPGPRFVPPGGFKEMHDLVKAAPARPVDREADDERRAIQSAGA